MDQPQYLPNSDSTVKENHIISVKTETQPVFKSNARYFSAEFDKSPTDIPHISPIESSEYKVTLDEVESSLSYLKSENPDNKNNDAVEHHKKNSQMVDVCEKKIKLEYTLIESKESIEKTEYTEMIKEKREIIVEFEEQKVQIKYEPDNCVNDTSNGDNLRDVSQPQQGEQHDSFNPKSSMRNRLDFGNLQQREGSEDIDKNYMTQTNQDTHKHIQLREQGQHTSDQDHQLHKISHSEEYKFSCQKCHKPFKRKQQLTRHELLVHSNERPFQCEICRKSFKLKQSLKFHEMNHIEERPFSCDKCGKSFVRKSLLVEHELVHGIERKHMCTLCGKTYIRKRDLAQHYRVHINERRFECDVCGKRFMRNQQLLQHGLVHSEERKFPCEVCAKPFARKDNLKKHMKNVHERPLKIFDFV